ncbi:hypothetical protein ACHWQZ_G001525 [Mnemiopsis leidyi]
MLREKANNQERIEKNEKLKETMESSIDPLEDLQSKIDLSEAHPILLTAISDFKKVKMNNLWVATDLGSLRGVCLKSEQNTVVTYDEISKKNEIVSLTSSENGQELYCTLKSGLVNVFDMAQNIYVNQFEMEGDLMTAFDIGDQLLTVAKNGQVHVWKDEEVAEKFKIGENVESCVKLSDGKIVSGGKENELKVWDLETQKSVFTSKNVPRDELDIRVPVWIKSISSPPNDSNILCVGTHYHQYRQYDIRVKRRPIVDKTWEELPIISLISNNTQCYLGNSKGDIGRLDLRNLKEVNKFRGAAGSVRSLALHHSEPYLASVGLDRHLRIHNTLTREVEHKFYLKNKLNCVVFTTEKIKESKEDEVDIWDQLEETGKRRKVE